jgi:hypothetical protein
MTDNYLKVIDAPGLLRDPYSKALINADVSALNEHRKKKRAMNAILNNSRELEARVDELSSKMDNIEIMLTKLLEKQSNG